MILVGRRKASTSVGRREAASDFTNNIYDLTIVLKSLAKIVILYTSCNLLARAQFFSLLDAQHTLILRVSVPSRDSYEGFDF